MLLASILSCICTVYSNNGIMTTSYLPRPTLALVKMTIISAIYRIWACGREIARSIVRILHTKGQRQFEKTKAA